MAALFSACFLCLFVVHVRAYSQLVNKTTIVRISSEYKGHGASRTVDGNFDQNVTSCSHTSNSGVIREAWLIVDLGAVYSVRSVKFWYRGDRTLPYVNTLRLQKYSIRVSNDTTVPPPESSCYTDPGNVTLPTIVVEDCKRTTRYIWIYQSNKPRNEPCPMLEICEVQIFGCKVGYYGPQCLNKCDHCKHSASCEVENGECDVQGCSNTGYEPPLCKKCVRGRYGLNCTKQCSHFCIDDDCNRSKGTCLKGCKRGYRGNLCNETCQNGTYGLNCSKTCGNCFKDTICHHVNGTCLEGCGAGYKTHDCNTTCNDGEYGVNCLFNCSGHCLNGEVCNKTDGRCRSCAVGYKEMRCDKACDATWYGAGCKFQCGHCIGEDNCHHVNGSCLLGCQKGFTGDLCFNRTLRIEVTPPGTLDLTVVLLIVCPVAGLLFIALCVVTMVFLSRHRHGKQKNKSTDEKFHKIEEQDNEDEESPKTLDDTILYTTVQIRSKSIKTTDLPSVIKSMGDDTDKGFTEEFNSIPYGEQSDILCTVGKLPENIPKNRFKTTFPYDHSRVVLQSSKNGDYINANFIKNTDGDAVYIASQGPKPKTVGDFWKMIWQENVFVIAMVTNLKEGDKIKCERYWPTSGDSKMVLEIFTVQLFSERIYANFSTHNLKLFNRETQETRLITHLQYTSWPDHGTPNPLELLSFYHYVSRAMEQHPEQKLVVHCSAGIGRTGTFIALDALHRQGVKKGKINIVEYVHTMREDRMNMIQNLNQYKFLYHALYESFRAGCHVLRKENFVQEMEAHIKSDKATNLSNFRTEFKELDSMKRIFDESEKQIGLQNLKLNMTENVLPADKMRIILSSHVPEGGTYYNAVPISTFTTKDCIIAGQYPVQGAGIDLIRLLVDQECSSLILTHPLPEIPHSGSWFSGPLFNYRVEVGPMNKLSADVNKYNVRIKPPSSKGLHKVSMYEITAWNPTENLPQVLLDAVKRIQLCELVDPERKLTILSRDGTSICGEFCAVYNAIQQVQQDQEVDMFNIVRLLQSRRPEMISDLNGYLLCCQAVAEFIKSDSEDTYMNSVSNTVTVEENMYANT